MTDDALTRIAAALERLAPAPMPSPDFDAADAFAWHTSPDRLEPVVRVARVDAAASRSHLHLVPTGGAVQVVTNSQSVRFARRRFTAVCVALVVVAGAPVLVG